MDAWAAKRLRTFEDAEQGLCFGRLDFEETLRPLYVGRRWVHDEERRQLVVNWQAPAARPFYTATPQDPHGVTLRRRFRTDGRRLVDIADESLDGSIVDGAAVGDFLLEELERGRERHMRDIVATIQADQYRLITARPAPPLVIQGGPGTGKTAVGLHRASYLLYSHRDTLARRGVLVVGPNRTFMEYVSHVLPALGEDAVEQRAVGELVDGIEPTLRDPPRGRGAEGGPAARRGDPPRGRAAARARSRRSSSRGSKARSSRCREREVRELPRRGTRGARPDCRRPRALPDEPAARASTRSTAASSARRAIRNFDEVEQALRANGLPRPRAQGGVAARRARPAGAPAAHVDARALAEAADGILDAAEQKLLQRRGAGWSDGDVAAARRGARAARRRRRTCTGT